MAEVRGGAPVVPRTAAWAAQRVPLGVALAACAAAALAALLAATLIWPPRPRLVWNASASSPIGLYAVMPGAPLRRGDMAIAWPPPAARRLAAKRHYLPASVPLVKRVAAIAGDRICARGITLSVNGRLSVERLRRDPSGRALPGWSGCRRLGRDELLLLSDAGPLAFDGRYFGASAPDEVIGRAVLLWARRPARGGQ